MKKMYILYTWHDFKQSGHKLNALQMNNCFV